MNYKSRHTNLIKKEAKRLGFLSCGISKAEFLEDEAPRLENWLNKNMHGEMSYMANHFDKRLDPTLLVPDSKSVVSLLLNYFPEETQTNETYKISKYAFGEDYHFVIKDKLKQLLNFIQNEIGEVHGRAFTDSAPVLDKAWAAKSGLGWIGKHSNLITKSNGSFYFIAELIIDLELDYDYAVTDHCGSCTACLDACPTQAITEPYVVDGSKCISYFTIELKNEIPSDMKGKFDDWMFGCDICQDVCPWTKNAQPTLEPAFNRHVAWKDFTKRDWQEITEEVFLKVFAGTPVMRAKASGLKKNIGFIKVP